MVYTGVFFLSQPRNNAHQAQILDPGSVFGQYAVKTFIAGGGIGQVYAATHTIYGSNVALKVLHPDLYRNAAWRERLSDEGVIGKGLKHPNVLTTREIVEHDGRMALVLDLARGASTLHRVIRREFSTGMPTELALRLMLGVLQGVEYAHQQGVIHGDIKPENIMLQDLDRAQSEWSALVTDFGTASLIVNPVLVDGAVAVVASPRYASPEHLEGVDALIEASDIFSLGLLLHYLLTGAHASPAKNVDEALAYVQEPLEISKLIDQPRLVMSVFRRAVALKPEERYASCREMALGIRSVIDALGAEFEDDIEADIPTVIMGDESEEVSLDQAEVVPDEGTQEAPKRASTGTQERQLNPLSAPLIPMTKEPTLRPAVRPKAPPEMFEAISEKQTTGGNWHWVVFGFVVVLLFALFLTT